MMTTEHLPRCDPDAEELLYRVAEAGGHPARLQLVRLLMRRDYRVAELVARHGGRTHLVHRHAGVLREQGALQVHYGLNTTTYSLAGGPVAAALVALLTVLEAHAAQSIPQRRPGAAVTARGRRATQQEE